MADADAVEAPTVNFVVSDTFEEFEVALENFKKNNFVEFYRRDSRTIEAAHRRGTDRPLKAELKYYFELEYCCIHGKMEWRLHWWTLTQVSMLKCIV